MASFNVAPPDKFAFKSGYPLCPVIRLKTEFSFKPNDWPKLITRFERFRIASELDKKPEQTQVATLIYDISWVTMLMTYLVLYQ